VFQYDRHLDEDGSYAIFAFLSFRFSTMYGKLYRRHRLEASARVVRIHVTLKRKPATSESSLGRDPSHSRRTNVGQHDALPRCNRHIPRVESSTVGKKGARRATKPTPLRDSGNASGRSTWPNTGWVAGRVFRLNIFVRNARVCPHRRCFRLFFVLQKRRRTRLHKSLVDTCSAQHSGLGVLINYLSSRK